jgi:hypothetical protein
LIGVKPMSDAQISPAPWSIEAERLWQSGDGALVKQPFALVSRRKLLITILAGRHYARRGLTPEDCIFGVAVRAAEVLDYTWQSGPPARATLENALENFSRLIGHWRRDVRSLRS